MFQCNIKLKSIKVQKQPLATSLKETLAKLLSCEYRKISKKSFFIDQLQWLLLKVLQSKMATYPIHSENNTIWFEMDKKIAMLIVKT